MFNIQRSKVKILGSIFLSLIFALSSSLLCLAMEYELEEIVVTAKKGFGSEIKRIPANITIIGPEEIESSNARTVPDLLQGQMGVSIRDWLGNGKTVNLDMRGFGEMSSSNCLVLIDGRRVNTIDMGNVDWSQISLSQVDRIEVVRGSGAVLYGDNASGGVINIITKKGGYEPQAKIAVSMSTPSGVNTSIDIKGNKDNFNYDINAGYSFGSGFRENNNVSAYDLGGRVTGYPLTWISVDVSAGFHGDEAGMPGPVNATQWRAGQYAESNTPYDAVRTNDRYARIVVDENIPGSLLFFRTDLGWRNRLSESMMYSTGAAWGGFDRRNFTAVSWGQKCSYEGGLFSARIGAEGELGYYDIVGTDTYGAPVNQDQNLDRTSIGMYADADVSLFKDRLLISMGARKEFFNHFFSAYTSTDASTNTLSVDALSAGVSYVILGDAVIFGRWDQSYRAPKVDEYYFLDMSGWPFVYKLNTQLKPQTGQQWEAGIKSSFFGIVNTAVTWFRYILNNELYYNPLTFANENYDWTLHEGVEFGVSARPMPILVLSGNYTYTDAHFIGGGSFNGKQIPIVPMHKGSAGVRLLLPAGIQVNTDYTYAGDRRFINDQQNLVTPMPPYATIDMKVALKKEGMNIYVGVNNLLDEKYAQYAVTNTAGTNQNYYPSPGRHFLCGIDLTL